MSLTSTPTKVQELNRSLIDLDNQAVIYTPHAPNCENNEDYKADHVYSVGKSKIPPFMEDSPETWFLLIKAKLHDDRIRSNDTKYTVVLRALDGKTLYLIADVLRKQPAKNKYNALK